MIFLLIVLILILADSIIRKRRYKRWRRQMMKARYRVYHCKTCKGFFIDEAELPGNIYCPSCGNKITQLNENNGSEE